MKRILAFLKDTLEETGAEGYVVGISGGVDSAVVVALCSQAVGKDKVYGVLMPTQFTPQEDIDHATYLLKYCGRFNIINFEYALQAFKAYLPFTPRPLVNGNLMARLRMCILYYVANQYNYLVCGTTNKVEDFLGYFTKYGDGACDLEPIIHLTKTQVRELAKELGLPKEIALKPSSPRLWKDHDSETELGIKLKDVDRLIGLHESTEHKRKQPHRLQKGSE